MSLETVVKEHATSDDDIVELSNSFAKDWMTVGCEQNVSQANLDVTDATWLYSHDKVCRLP